MDNSVLLVYLWGIYPQIGVLVDVIIIMIIISFIFSWVPIVAFDYTQEQTINNYKTYWKKPAYALIVLVALSALTPTRNVAIMMFSAPKIIELAKTASDSNATKQIGNILSNSLELLEKKSEKMLDE